MLPSTKPYVIHSNSNRKILGLPLGLVEDKVEGDALGLELELRLVEGDVEGKVLGLPFGLEEDES